MKLIFKKVPSGETHRGTTELNILKKYIDDGLIDDPKDLPSADISDSSRSYPVKISFGSKVSRLLIRAYQTENWSKDRRLILTDGNHPLKTARNHNDFVCYLFENKITRDSIVEIRIIKPNSEFYKSIDELYNSRNGLVLDSTKSENELLISKIIPNNEFLISTVILNKIPLNQILYGPPGTGKTYKTITKALDIIGIPYSNYTEAQRKFSEELGRRIEFVTMHQNFSYEDFVQGLKPQKSDDGKNITFDYKDGVFKSICKRAEASLTGDEDDDKDTDKEPTLNNEDILKIAFYLSKFNGKMKKEKHATKHLGYRSDKEAFSSISEKTIFSPNSIRNHRDFFDFKFTDRIGYTARSGRNPHNGTEDLDNTSGWPYKEIFDELNPKTFEDISAIVDGLLQKIDLADIDLEGNNNHVIVLDEINRANISRVFGELISLIEEDKRDGNLSVSLPSGHPFTVPGNLYIIGTMNTADKSIALVDIALRRRFRFEAMYPDASELRKVLKEKGKDDDEIEKRVNLMNALNYEIRTRKSVDFEIGHSYFMAEGKLENVVTEQIIPLLNEYFMYALKTVKSILEAVGVKCNSGYFKDRGLIVIEGIDLKPAIDIKNENNEDNEETDSEEDQ